MNYHNPNLVQWWDYCKGFGRKLLLHPIATGLYIIMFNKTPCQLQIRSLIAIVRF